MSGTGNLSNLAEGLAYNPNISSQVSLHAGNGPSQPQMRSPIQQTQVGIGHIPNSNIPQSYSQVGPRPQSQGPVNNSYQPQLNQQFSAGLPVSPNQSLQVSGPTALPVVTSSFFIMGYTIPKTYVYVIGAILCLVVGYYLWNYFNKKGNSKKNDDDEEEDDEEEDDLPNTSGSSRNNKNNNQQKMEEMQRMHQLQQFQKMQEAQRLQEMQKNKKANNSDDQIDQAIEDIEL